jgi:hypothetical protein
LDQLPQPALDDKNPAAQLAEAYANEATEAAKELNRKAEELAKNSAFGDEVMPTKEQLASATAQQEMVKGDVEQTAEDIARAARHEQRLEKAAVASALQQASENVEQVANNEATKARQQLETASQAAVTAPQPTDQQPQNNQPALAANVAVAQSEQAISDQAKALTGVLTPMQQAQAAAASGEPAAPDASAQPAAVQQANNATPGSEPPAAPGASAPQAFTPEEMATGRQLAQSLDELDRMQANAAAAQEGQPSPSPQTPLQQALAQRPGLAQAAQAQQAQIAAARAQAQQQAALANNPTGYQQDGIPAYEGQAEAFAVQPVNRDDDKEWGKLREQSADDLTKGRKEAVSEEYRKSVETYFRVLAERARGK